MGTIENLLRAGVPWSVVEAATGIDQDALRALRQRLEGSERGDRKKPTESEAVDCSVRPRSASHAQAVLGFRGLSSRSPQNPTRRLDVGLTLRATPLRPSRR